MRSPPPIPPLRGDLLLEARGPQLVIVDRALGRRHRLDGPLASTVAAIVPHLVARPPTQAELSAAVRRPRLEVQEAVAALLGLHGFDTPRARYLRAAASLARARQRSAPSLFVGHPLLPRDRVAFLRALSAERPLRTLGDLVAASSRLVGAVEAFERRFELSEVFATRDAFHIVRPDPEEAPARLGRLVSGLAVASRSLPPSVRAGLDVFLSGGRPAGTRLPASGLLARRRRGAPLLEVLGAQLLQVFVFGDRAPTPDEAVALSEFWRAGRADALELLVLQGPVFLGLGAPRACPPWWPR